MPPTASRRPSRRGRRGRGELRHHDNAGGPQRQAGRLQRDRRGCDLHDRPGGARGDGDGPQRDVHVTALHGNGGGNGLERRQPRHAGLHVLLRHVHHAGGPERGDALARRAGGRRQLHGPGLLRRQRGLHGGQSALATFTISPETLTAQIAAVAPAPATRRSFR